MAGLNAEQKFRRNEMLLAGWKFIVSRKGCVVIAPRCMTPFFARHFDSVREAVDAAYRDTSRGQHEAQPDQAAGGDAHGQRATARRLAAGSQHRQERIEAVRVEVHDNHDWWIGTPVHHSYEKCTRRAYGLMQESRERTLPMGAVRWTSNPSPTGRLLQAAEHSQDQAMKKGDIVRPKHTGRPIRKMVNGKVVRTRPTRTCSRRC
jgi:hypothetical protein